MNSPRFLNIAYPGESFFIPPMNSKTDYPKKIISIDKQIQRLQERGLSINDIGRAKEFLKNISYFRLQGFWWEYQSDKENHQFKEGTTFVLTSIS